VWKWATTDPYDASQNTGCTSALTCFARGVSLVESSQWNVAKAVADDAKGIVDLVKDPASLVDAAAYIRDHPGDALRQLVWDDESAKLWGKGNYLGAIGRTAWNVGSWVIPGVDIAKVFSKAGKFSKLGKVGKLGKLGKLADDSGKAARRAEQLANKGDVNGARKAVADAVAKLTTWRTKHVGRAARSSPWGRSRSTSEGEVLPQRKIRIVGRRPTPSGPPREPGRHRGPDPWIRSAEHSRRKVHKG